MLRFAPFVGRRVLLLADAVAPGQTRPEPGPAPGPSRVRMTCTCPGGETWEMSAVRLHSDVPASSWIVFHDWWAS